MNRPTTDCLALLTLALALLCPSRAASADAGGLDTNTRAEPYIRQAQQLDLASQTAWLRMGYWKTDRHGRIKSELDRAFFLAASGRNDPAAELVATLQGLFATSTTTAERSHTRCRFPGRTFWLQQQLAIPPEALAPADCPLLTRYLERSAAFSSTYVFSSYYMSNPASAFGHTFLRFNRAPHVYGQRRELLDLGVDYAALIGPGEGQLSYALRSLAGAAHGVYSFLPYYFKVRDYNDSESRDLWEYQLNLTPVQQMMLVLHLWELEQSRIQYYFIDRNCSYQLLAALEVANPELTLTDGFLWHVIPGETVKALHSEPGLIQSVRRRPSVGTRFRTRMAMLSRDQQKTVEHLVRAPATPLSGSSTTASARLLDAALDYVDFRYSQELIFEKDPEIAELKHTLLARRAALGVTAETLPDLGIGATAPHLAHNPYRLTVGGGYRGNLGAYARLDARLAFHDLLDAAIGYPELGEVRFMDLRLDFYDSGPRVRDFTLFEVKTLVPRDRFSGTMSWIGRVGTAHLNDDRCADCTVLDMALGAGSGVASTGKQVSLFLIGGAHFKAHEQIAGIGNSPVRLELAPRLFFRARIGESFSVIVDGSLLWAPEQAAALTYSADFGMRVALAQNWAVGIDGRARDSDLDLGAAAFWYFGGY